MTWLHLKTCDQPSPDIGGHRFNIPRHPSILCTLPLTETSMPPNPPSSLQFPGSGPRVHSHRFSDDEAIGDELADCLTRVGIADLIDFIGIEPDLSFTASYYGCRKPLLSAKIDPKFEKGR